MRIVKEAEERKNEILDVAERLFTVKGFDRASTNDILNEIGIARGTLYYHFSSKEEILDAIIGRLIDSMTSKAQAIAGDKSIPVLERLTKTILALNVENETGELVMEQVHKPQNALMHQKMTQQLLERVNPMILEIMKDGIDQGIFHSEYPEETVEMIMLYSNTTFDRMNELEPEEQARKVAGFIYNLERLLGTDPGVMQEVILPIFQR